jgi:hypothetical protein
MQVHTGSRGSRGYAAGSNLEGLVALFHPVRRRRRWHRRENVAFALLDVHWDRCRYQDRIRRQRGCRAPSGSAAYAVCTARRGCPAARGPGGRRLHCLL